MGQYFLSISHFTVQILAYKFIIISAYKHVYSKYNNLFGAEIEKTS
jgi:hypothetical protein